MAVVGLACVFAGIVCFHSKIDHRWLWGSLSYSSLDVNLWNGVLLRLGWYTVASTACAGFLWLMPDSRTTLTRIGARSLPVFLWHGFFVGLIATLVNSSAAPLLMQLQFILFAAFACVALSSDVVDEVTRQILKRAVALVTAVERGLVFVCWRPKTARAVCQCVDRRTQHAKQK